MKVVYMTAMMICVIGIAAAQVVPGSARPHVGFKVNE